MVAPFRILAVSHSANLDGAEQVFLETCRSLHARGHAVDAILPARGPLSQALENVGLPVEFLPLPWWILPPGELDAGHFLAQLGPQVQQLRERIRARNIQVVHTSTSVVLHGALAAALEGIPHLWQVHEMLGEPACGLDPTLGPAATWQLLAQLTSPCGGKLVVASPAMQALAKSFLNNAPGASAEAVTLLPHGHDLSAYLALPEGSSLSAKSRARSAAPVRFVVIASVTPRKGLDWLINAVADQVLPAGDLPPFEIEIIGAAHDRAYLKELQALAKSRKVANRFTWAGYCNDLPERLRTARAVLHPSRNDPSPVGLILAMAAARPIVATRCGGPEAMLEDGVSGRLVALEDPAGFGAEIVKLLRDPAYGATWGGAARRHAEATWSMPTYVDRLEALYAGMAAAARTASVPQVLNIELWLAILDACHRHTGAAAGELKHLTPRQKKALNGIVKSAKLLKKTLPANLYDKLAGLW